MAWDHSVYLNFKLAVYNVLGPPPAYSHPLLTPTTIFFSKPIVVYDKLYICRFGV